MASAARDLLHLSPDDETLDASALPGAGARRPKSKNWTCPKVELIDQSSHGMVGETQSLLRFRLRSASLVLFLGALAFLIRDFFVADPVINDPMWEFDARIAFGFQVLHVVVLGLTTAALWKFCAMPMAALRFCELLVFGLTAAFFFFIQHLEVLFCAMTLGFVPNPSAMWFALILVYAIFIPNHWRRAAIILGIFAALPVIGLLLDAWRCSHVGTFMRQYDQLSGIALMMLVGWAGSVYGTHVINNLRRQAYEARRLGQYHLRSLLGAGGMGEVYLAEHQLLKRPCAIKVIRPGKAADPMSLARFEREVRSIAQLSHWNTVEIFDYGRTEDGTFYYVMEYLPGLSLHELVSRHGPLPPERVIYLLRQVCDALREAHALGLVHRDVKPGNIFSALRGGYYDVAKLLDFGLVKQQHTGPDSIHLTVAGTFAGSPLFMSPEQFLGEREPDARSDIYALGAVAYYLLVGRPPFEGDKAMPVLLSHARDPVKPPSQLRSEIPTDLEAVVLRCLEKRPEDRYQDAESLSRALGECQSAGLWNAEIAAHWWQTHEGVRCAAMARHGQLADSAV